MDVWSGNIDNKVDEAAVTWLSIKDDLEVKIIFDEQVDAHKLVHSIACQLHPVVVDHGLFKVTSLELTETSSESGRVESM